MNSRYYNPEIHRFISPDSFEYIDETDFSGLNLYCYCMNNPVMYVDPTGHAPKWWQSILIGVGVIVGAALIATAITFTGGGAAAFFLVAGKVVLAGLKIAAVTGVVAGVVRAGKTAIEGGTLEDVGKSLVLGFSDGFLASSIYAGSSMLLSAGSFRLFGLLNGGRGWTRGKFMGGYQTPKTPGITALVYKVV